MSLPRTTEVVVIGGGLLGTSTAYQLAGRGVEVTVVERNELGRQASGTNWGFIWIQTQPTGYLLDFAMASNNMYDTLSNELGFDIEYVRCGGLIALEEEEDVKAAHVVVASQEKAGVDIGLLNGDEVRQREPSFSKTIVGAVYSPLDGKVNPIYLTIGLAEAAKKYGAKIITGTEVKAIEVKGEQIHSVVTDQGKIKTHMIVNAAGIWAREIGRMVGIDIPIVCHQGEVIVTEPLPPLVSHLVYSGSCVRVLVDAITGDPTVPCGSDAPIADYGYVQHATGNVTLGTGTGIRDFLGADKAGSYRNIKEMANWGTRIIPALRDARIIRSWTGLKPGSVSPSAEGPIIDKVEFRKSCMIVVVDTGHGVAFCPINGKLTAELIALGRKNTSLSIENCRLPNS
jgi:glycine/D-amino acid oxidase-like deaminating enzyme